MTVILYIFLSILGGVLNLLIRIFNVRIINLLGKIWSFLAWYIFTGKRAIVEEELRRLFGNRYGDKEIRDITRRSFDNHCRKQVEYMFFGYLDMKTIEKMVSVKGLENLDAALAGGKGVILLLSHFGSFLLPLVFLSYRGYRVNQITGRDIHTNNLQDIFWRWRKGQAERLPISFIQVGSFLRPVYERLRNSEIVAVAFDGRDGVKWIPVKLFNRTAVFSAGPVNLALKTGAAIVPTFIIRRDGGHSLVLEPPFELQLTGSKEEDLKINTERYAGIFTEYLQKYPCHMGMVFQIVRSYSEKGLGIPLFQEIEN